MDPEGEGRPAPKRDHTLFRETTPRPPHSAGGLAPGSARRPEERQGERARSTPGRTVDEK
eukprot:9372547-Pyramimonas_sp.AAC.1